MKIALTVWEDRISPVFDAATTLLLVELGDGDIVKKRIAPLQPAGSMRFAEMLKQMNVTILICGAISEGHANRLSFSGIELIPFISGKTDKILDTFAKGEPIIPAFSMPGCGKQYCRRMSEPSQTLNPKEVTEMPGKDRTGPAGQGPKTGQGKGRCKSGPGAGKGRNPGRGQGGGGQGGGGQGGGGGGQGRRQP